MVSGPHVRPLGAAALAPPCGGLRPLGLPRPSASRPLRVRFLPSGGDVCEIYRKSTLRPFSGPWVSFCPSRPPCIGKPHSKPSTSRLMASTDAPRPTRRQTPDPKGTGGRRPREPKGAKSPAGRYKGRRAQRAHLRPAKSWAALGPSPRFLPFGCRPLGAGAEPQLGPLRAVAAFRPFGLHPSRPAFRLFGFETLEARRASRARRLSKII